MLIEGRSDVGFFDAQIGPARADVAARQAALVALPQNNVIAPHPAALNEMAEILAWVAAHLPDVDPQEDREVVDSVRSIIRHVTVIERGDGSVNCDITGNIAPLVAANLVGGVW